MAEREIYRLEVSVSTGGVEESKKKLSSMDKFVEGSEKRIKQLDRAEANPAVKLQDKITSPLKKMEGKIGSFAKTAIKRFTAIATAGALVVGGLGIKDTMSTFMDFEAGLSSVQAVSQATADEMRILKDEAKRLGAETEWSAVQVAEAEMLLSQAGFKVQETVGALPGLLDLASAGGLDLANATDIAAGTLRAFGMEAEQAGHVANVLAVASSSTNSDVMGLGESMKYVGPAAKAMGIDVEQATATLGMLANANIKGSQAGTTLRSALTRLAKPTKQSSDMMKQLGFNAFDTQGKMLPMHEVIANLEKSTSGLTEQQKANAMATIFGQEAMSGMLALVEQGPDALKELTDSLYDSEGAAKQMAETRLDNLAGQMTILKSATEGMKIELGERLTPYAKQFVEWLTPKIPIITEKIVELVDRASEFASKAYPAVKEFIGGFKDMIPTIMKLMPLIVGIGTAVATLKIGNKISGGIKAFKELKTLFSATVTNAGGVAKAIGLIISPAGLVALAVGALVTGFIIAYKNSETFRNKVHELKDAFVAFITPIIDTAMPILESLGSAFMGFASAIIPFVMSGLELLMGVFDVLWNIVLQPLVEFVLGVFSNGFQTAFTIIGDIVTNVVTTVTGILGGLSSILRGISDFIVGIFTGNWEQAWEGIKGITSGAIEVVKSLGTGIITHFKEMPGHMLAIGKDIMQGLANGIKNAVSIPINAVKNVGKSIVGGIKGVLNIKSPSRVMMELGEFTTEGMALGMEEKIPRLEAVVGTTYDVIAKEDNKINKVDRTGFAERVVNKVRELNPFNYDPDPDGQGKPRPIPVAVAGGGGGGSTYNIYIDDIDVNISEREDGEDIDTVVEKAQEEFGRKLLQAIKDKK